MGLPGAAGFADTAESSPTTAFRMHASSFENMERCHARYVTGAWTQARDGITVLDVGGADVNGGYRPIFHGPGVRYLTADLSAGDGVDVVLDDPYRLPFDDGSLDIVVSGQMLEHCEFFWLSFAEMMRVLKPDGFLFLIAPSAGPIHRYPVDCYRFYPDAYRALARHSGCHMIESWLDERGPWRDLVGVFSHAQVAVPEGPTRTRQPIAPIDVAAGSAEQEAVSGRIHYRDTLTALHERLAPRRYLEIGVRRGGSLALARCEAIGIDPQPELDSPLPANATLHELASDDYFAADALSASAPRPDFAFIDGMHLFEFVLRDFMNVERRAHPGALIVIDDIFPSHPLQASRERRTRVWTGDVWKLHACLAEFRKDLLLIPLDTTPTGLLLVAGLDPGNRVLWDRYNPIVRRFTAPADPPPEVLGRDEAWAPDDPRVGSIADALREARASGASRTDILRRLRAIASRPA